MTKEERVVKYLELAAKYCQYDTSHFQKELDVSDDDVREIQEKKEKELSLKPVEKRNEVVKKVIKPLLKKHGFSVAGTDWRRRLEDDLLHIDWLDVCRKNSDFPALDAREFALKAAED